MPYQLIRDSRFIAISAGFLALSVAYVLPVSAQLGQSEWINPDNSQPGDSQTTSPSELGQSDWITPAQQSNYSQAPQQGTYQQQQTSGRPALVKPAANSGTGWLPTRKKVAPISQQQKQPALGQSDWITPAQQSNYSQAPQQGTYQQQQQTLGQSDWITPAQQSNYRQAPQQGAYQQPTHPNSGPFQVPQNTFNPEPDFANPDLQLGGNYQTPAYGGEVSQNQFLPQQTNQPFTTDGGMMGFGAQGFPGNNTVPGLGGMSGFGGPGGLSGLGGFGDPSTGGLDFLGKAIGAAAQLGLFQNQGSNSSGGLGLPRFGSQMGSSGYSTDRRPSSSVPGGQLGRTLTRSVNRALDRGINQAVNQGFNRALGGF